MIKAIATATILAVTTTAAAAETISLKVPMQAASLHEGGVDMVVYFLEHVDHFVVVATYSDSKVSYDPVRMKMALTDGDAVNFALPGLPQLAYGFSRTDDQVQVTAEFTDQIVASAK